MSISQTLKNRNQGLCELCNENEATVEYLVNGPGHTEDEPSNQVAICITCLNEMNNKKAGFHWRCIEGSIWSPEKSVQALSYRIGYFLKDEEWANNLINAVDLDENTIQWAVSVYEKADVHTDAYGNVLANGDNVVLIQALDVKGTNFTASKGTVVKKIKLVHDNAAHIEGKINDQTIVILTKYVKKG